LLGETGIEFCVVTECALCVERALVGIQSVIGVDQSCPEVCVAQPLLDGTKRSAGGGQLGGEGVAEVVKARRAKTCAPDAGLKG